ncbi:MAG: glycosyltransferase [Anaerolineae bacterium]|nr:glycosyltransferase [Anaerolineae bacterium]MCB0223515.1 glycosyltransferase [Anaerolineae bacterium]MCB9109362.1 glycosyltransferase [Anaerolineales bacterium]
MIDTLQPTIKCSVGITAHNEEANIGEIIEAVTTQRLHQVEITEIIIVASGCTDSTVEIIESYMSKEPRLKLFIQERREGKTSAINIFLRHAQENICVLESGDTIPHEDAIENMVRMFNDPAVGMTGAHKVPVNTPEHIIGLLSHLRLKMEHQLCLEIPRLGELIAFRKLFDEIPPDVAMDEAFVEALVIKRGLQVRYAPDAVVFNMGPETLSDFVKQRRRNHAGHLHLRAKYGYEVSSMGSPRLVKLALEEIWGALQLIWILGVLAAVEGFSRLLGWWDYKVHKKTHVVWDIAWTTKEVKRPINVQGINITSPHSPSKRVE